MRDVFAGVVAIVLLLVAASLGTTLQRYRRRRQRARDSERALGRTVIVEIPGDGDLILFSEDQVRFHHGEHSIDKGLIVAVRLLINGIPIAEARRDTTEYERKTRPAAPELIDFRGDGIARDRWDVEIETRHGATLVECGSIRERVSQELAREVFDAVKRAVQR